MKNLILLFVIILVSFNVATAQNDGLPEVYKPVNIFRADSSKRMDTIKVRLAIWPQKDNSGFLVKYGYRVTKGFDALFFDTFWRPIPVKEIYFSEQYVWRAN